MAGESPHSLRELKRGLLATTRAARHDAGCSPRPTRSACAADHAAASTLGARKTSRSVAWRTVACSTPSVRAITDALHEQL